MEKLEIEFVLDKKLASDSVILGDLPLSRVLLINDQQYPWLVLVPRRAKITEIYQLSLDDRALLMEESCQMSAVLADGFSATKMNFGALGNIVKQLHLHHIVRFDTDIAWPGPVWGKYPSQPYDDKKISGMEIKMKKLLGLIELKFIAL